MQCPGFKVRALGRRIALGYADSMTLRKWGQALLLWGLAIAVVTFVPALFIHLTPPAIYDGVIGLIILMLPFSVTPLAVVVASVGAILLLVAAVRRDRF